MTPAMLVATIVGISQRVISIAVCTCSGAKRAMCGTYQGASSAPSAAHAPSTTTSTTITVDARCQASSSRSVLT